MQRARDAGTLRMGTVDSFLCDRLGAGFATDTSTASRTQLHRLGTPGFDARLCELFGVPPEVLPEVRDTAGELGTLRHDSWPVELPLCGQVVDQQAALAGAGCVVPGRVKATYGTGVFVLGHVGDEVPRPAGGLLPTVAWRIDGRMEYAIDGGVFAAGAMLEWMCRELGMADEPGRARRARARRRGQRRRARAARPRGRRRALVEAGRARRDRRHARRHRRARTWRAPRSRASPGGWPTWSPRCARPSRWTRCAWTAASRTSRCCSSSRPTRSACAWTPPARTRPCWAPRRWARWAPGVIPSLADAAELLPVDRSVEPQRDDAWRAREHERWKAFVLAAVELPAGLGGR